MGEDAWSEEALVKAWRELASVPHLTGGRILSRSADLLQVSATFAVRDLERNTKRSHRCVYTLAPESLEALAPPLPYTATEGLVSHSPDGSLRLELRKEARAKRGNAAASTEPTPFLDLFCLKTGQRLKTMSLDGDEVPHGLLHSHAELGPIAWSSDSASILYIAERKSKSIGYSQSGFPPKPAKGASEEEVAKAREEWGREFLKMDSWGEQMTEIREPQLCRLELASGTVTVLKTPANFSPAFPTFTPDGSGCVFVGLADGPYRLGKIYCGNRRSGLFHLDFADGTVTELSVPGQAEAKQSLGQCLGQIRWAEDESGFVVFAQDAGGAHQKAVRLVWLDWPKFAGRVVVETVAKPSPGSFPGLYQANPPLRCFRGRRLFLSSVWGCADNVLAVDLADTAKAITPVKLTNTDSTQGSYTLLDVAHGFLLIAFSSPTTPPALFVAPVPENLSEGLHLSQVSLGSVPPLDEICFGVHKFRRDVAEGEEAGGPLSGVLEDVAYEGFLIGPTEKGQRRGLVVMPHGGPHGASLLRWSPWTALLSRLRLCCLQINYRGSLGYGDQFVEALLGRVGRTDVWDVVHATKTTLESGLGLESSSKVFLFGGSHGGFLVAHLGARYPETFTAVSALNPVMDLDSMVSATDICDWCWVEGLGAEFDPRRGLSGPERQRLWEASPVAHVKEMRLPFLLLTGTVDARVPPSQANEWMRVLKAKGVPNRHLAYPLDCHPLDRVDTETDWVVGTLRWFHQHSPLS